MKDEGLVVAGFMMATIFWILLIAIVNPRTSGFEDAMEKLGYTKNKCADQAWDYRDKTIIFTKKGFVENKLIVCK